jgi:hypothetical protein
MIVGPEISILQPAVGHTTEPVRSTSRVHNLIPEVISSSYPPVSSPLFQVDIFQSQKFSNTERFTVRGCYPYVHLDMQKYVHLSVIRGCFFAATLRI